MLSREVLEVAVQKYRIECGPSGGPSGVSGVTIVGPQGPLRLFSRNGYLQFGVPHKGRSRNVFVHRFVARLKYGLALYAPGTEVRHLDGDPQNNHPDNLALGSRRDNILDRPKEVRVASATRASHEARRRRRNPSPLNLGSDWRECACAPGYFVSAQGDVLNAQGCKLKGTVAKGYVRVNLGGCHHLVHRLVLEAFVGPCPPGHETRHLDGNPRNNQLSNLAWGTAQENTDDKRRHGTELGAPRGERNGRARFSDVEIAQIRDAEGTVREVAARFGCSPSYVSMLRKGERRELTSCGVQR